MRATRGLRYSVTRLIAPPLPAASRPSKMTTSRGALGAHPLLQLDQLGLQPQAAPPRRPASAPASASPARPWPPSSSTPSRHLTAATDVSPGPGCRPSGRGTGDFESMPGVLRQAEHALADDVAHDLVAAAGDAAARRAEHQLAPRVGAPLAGVGDQLRARAPCDDEVAEPRRCSCVPASLAMLISGPGSWPALILSIARWLL